MAVAEADGNRTRLAEMLGHNGFEDRAHHQTRYASAAHPSQPGPLGPTGSQVTSSPREQVEQPVGKDRRDLGHDPRGQPDRIAGRGSP